jgi:nucleoside-diphosphate-sugar epimerase
MTFETAIVTGASGFIGRALCKHLQRNGKAVLAISRHESTDPPEARWLGHMAKPDTHQLREILKGTRIDAVFHCAAYGVKPSDRTVQDSFDGNILAMTEWVEVAADLGAAVFVYTGSCSEYGNAPPGIPISESTPLAATDLYGASKAAGGVWGRAVAQKLGIRFQWMRLFGVYGPGEGPTRLLPYIVSRLREGLHVDLTPGRQYRDFLFIDDVVTGLQKAAETAEAGPFNLCSGKPVTIREFSEAVAAHFKSGIKSPLDFGARPYRADEPLWMVGNPENFIRSTGFQPEITLSEGISRSINAMHPRDR